MGDQYRRNTGEGTKSGLANSNIGLSAGRSFRGAASDAPTLLLYIGMQLRL